MPQEFFTVANGVTGQRARVPQRRLAHLNDDWKVVEDEAPAPRPRKRTAPRVAPEPQAPDTDEPPVVDEPVGEAPVE